MICFIPGSHSRNSPLNIVLPRVTWQEHCLLSHTGDFPLWRKIIMLLLSRRDYEDMESCVRIGSWCPGKGNTYEEQDHKKTGELSLIQAD